MTIRIFIISLLLISKINLPAQVFLNTNFEYQNGGYSKADIWESTTPGLGKKKAELIIDTITKTSGKSSLLLISKDSGNHKVSDGLGVAAYLPLPVWDSIFKGKQIRIEGYLKFEPSDDSSYATLFAVTGTASNGSYSQKKIDLESQKITSPANWRKYALTFTYDSGASYCLTGVQIKGVGKLYCDNFSIWVNDKPIVDNCPYREPAANDLKWVRKNSILIKEKPEGQSNYSKTIEYLNPHQIIGIGEFSHGSSEVFVLRNSITKELLKKQDVVFVLEAELMDCISIQDYIDGNNNTTVLELLKNLKVWPWMQQQMIDLIEFGRENNKNNKYKLRFVGIDMQYYNTALNIIREAVKNNILYSDTSSFQKFEKFYARQYFSKPYARFKDSIDYFNASFGILENDLQKNKNSISQTKGQGYFDKLQSSVSILMQYNYLSKNRLIRDTFLFQNLMNYLQKFPNSKFIISAHNRHVINDNGKLGSLIKKQFGKNYLVIGTATSTGTYTAYDTDEKKLKNNNNLFEPITGTLEYYLQRINYQMSLLKLNTDKTPAFLTNSINFRGISAIVDEVQFERVDVLYKKYDAIIFIRETTGTTILK